MRVAIVVWDLNIKGGTQRQALELALALQKADHQVTVLTYLYDQKNCYEDICRQLTVRAVQVGQPPAPKPSPRWVSIITAPWRIVRNLFFDPKITALARLISDETQKESFDVINLHDYEVYKLAGSLRGQNVVWMMNDLVGVPPAYERGLQRGTLATILGHLTLWAARRQIKQIRQIVVLDNWNKRLCRQYYGRDATVVRSGVDLDLFRGINTAKPSGPIEIFASGIFFPHRRFEDLVMAGQLLAKKGVKNWHITINGSTARAHAYYQTVKGLIEEYQLTDQITHINGLPEAELLRHYAQAHIFVFPNHEQTWGLSIFEAMLAGCAAIVSRSCGGAEVLTDRENVYLVDPKSPDQIATAIEELIVTPKKRGEIAAAGRKFVVNNLSWSKYAQAMIKVFQAKGKAR